MATFSAAVSFIRKVRWLLVCIARLMGSVPHQQPARSGIAFEVLERCDGNLSCTVFRGKGAPGPAIYPVHFFNAAGSAASR
jgi:hypothetical protein